MLPLELLGEIGEWELKASVIFYNAAISACQSGAEWFLSFQLSKGMRHWYLKANVISYSAAICACEKGVGRLLPFELLKEM